MKVKVKFKKNEGITLLALVVTIIVLLILSTITINMLTGENGIIKNTEKAKEATEIADEKEIVQRATVNAIGKNKYGNLKQDELEKQLNEEQEGKTEVTDVGDEFEILFKESNRYYTVDKDGNIKEEQIATKIENAGDITKNNQYDGSEERPYQISCIEDLVAWSNMVDGNGVIYQNGKIVNLINKRTTFSGKYIELTRDLNFKSNYSYGDSTRTDFGDLNTDGTIETIKEELTKTDEGCIGFTPIGLEWYKRHFGGIFNGNDFEIRNIYINGKNSEKSYGLFGNASHGEIKNLTVKGIIKATGIAAGLVGQIGTGENVVNCKNYCEIISTENFAGGIIGYSRGPIINKCANFGNINGKKSAGGIVGYEYASVVTVKNSYNMSDVFSEDGYAGGIFGETCAGSLNIFNCYNKAKVNNKNSEKGSAGILGFKYHTTNLKIENCVNLGICTKANRSGGIIGWNWVAATEPEAINCYYKNYNGIKGEGTNPKTQTIGFDFVSDEMISKLNEYVDKHNLENDGDVLLTWNKDNGDGVYIQ